MSHTRKALLIGVALAFAGGCSDPDSPAKVAQSNGADAAGGSGGQAGSAGEAGSAGQAGGAGEAGSGGQAGSGGTGAVPSECRVTAPTRLAWGVNTDSELESNGRFVHYLGTFSSLWRVPVNGGDPSEMHQNTISFALTGGGAFYGTGLGEIGMVTDQGVATKLATGHVARRLAASGERVFWREMDDASQRASFHSVPRSGGAVSQLFSREAVVGRIEVSGDAIYWNESPSGQDTVSLIRAGLDGSSPVAMVEGIPGFVDFDVSGDNLAIATRTEVSLGPASAGARRVTIVDKDVSAVAIDGETVYYARIDTCTPMPNAGNGSPVCTGKVFRFVGDGGAKQELFSTEGAPTGLALDSACVYVSHIIGQCHPGCAVGLDGAPR